MQVVEISFFMKTASFLCQKILFFFNTTSVKIDILIDIYLISDVAKLHISSNMNLVILIKALLKEKQKHLN